ncbi:MAG: DinB family protein [Phycisphaerales bacterium]|nr:DinB family protein [Phycisphaerales bacterium]
MKAIDLIRDTLTSADQGMAHIVEDLRAHPLLQPTLGAGNGGNHALWTLGHLAYLESQLPRIILGPSGEPSRYDHWATLFATGTAPKTDGSQYPTFDEVLRACRVLRAQTLALLDQVGEANLDERPKAVPPGFEDAMRTCGHAFMLIALHQMVHYGQLTDVRRVAGLPPAF